MGHRTKLLSMSLFSVTSAALIVAAVIIGSLYRVSMEQRRAELTSAADRQARLIEIWAGADSPNSASVTAEAILQRLTATHQRSPGWGTSGELAIVQRAGNDIVYLLSQRPESAKIPPPVPWDSTLAEPARRSLSGQRGAVVGVDYRGARVLAAYEPVAGLNWGVVAKIDLAEIRAPFVRTGILAAGVTLLTVVVGGLLTLRVSRAWIDRLARAEEFAQENELRLLLQERALDSTQDGILITDPRQADNPIVDCNWGFERLTGYKREEILGRNCRFLQGTDRDQPALKEVRAALRDERECQVKLRNYRKDGTPFWNELTISPVRAADGSLTHFIGVVRDVSRRQDAEEQLIGARDELEQRVAERTAEMEASLVALRTSEERVRVLLDSTAEAIYGIDLRGECTFANPACVRLLGYQSDADLLGQNMHELLHHTRADGTPNPVEQCRIDEAFQHGEGTHATDEVFWRADGTSFPVEYWSYPTFQQGEATGSVVTFLDITERREAEAAIRTSRDFADTVINSLPGVFYVFDQEGGFLRWNKNVELVTGYTPSELAQMTPLDFFHEEDREMIAARMQDVFTKGVSTAQADYVFKDGTSAPFLFTGIRFESEGRQLLIGIGIDVSEQHKAEEKLRHNAKRLEVIGEIMESLLRARSTSQIAQAAIDRLGSLIACDRSSIVLFDGQLETATMLAMRGFRETSLKVGATIPIDTFGDIESLREGTTYQVADLAELSERSAPQQTIFEEGVRSYVCVPLCVEGDLVGTLNIAATQANAFSEEDVSIAWEVARPLAVGIRQSQLHAQVLEHANVLELRVEERTGKLAEAETRFRLVVEATPNALIMADSQGVIQLANAQAESLFGYTREQLVGQAVEMLVPENRRADHPALRGAYVAEPRARAMGAGRDLAARRRDGSEVPVEIGLNPLTIEGETFVLASIVDITERMHAEVALRESEGRFRELFENANDLIQAVSPEGKFVYVNPAWHRTLGYSPEELESITIFDVIHPESLDQCMVKFRQVMEGQDVGTIEAAFKAKDGTRVLVEGNASCRFDKDGRPDVSRSIFRNVTERKEAEDLLRDGVVIGQLRYDIHVALATRGTLRDVLTACAEAIVSHLEAAFARIWLLDEEEQVLTLQASAGMYTHLDGPHGRIPVGEFKIGMIAKEKQPHLTNAVLGDERVSDQEWAEREKMVAFAGYPLIADNRVIGVMAMFARHELTDATMKALESIAQGMALGIERVNAEEELREALVDLAARTRELEVAKDQAEAADRVKSAFLATMSHELRTPLNSIIGFTGIMSKGLTGPLNDEQEKQLGMVQGSARHLLSLINDVLDISKIEAGQFEIESKPFCLGATIDKAVKTVTPAAEQKNLTISTRIAPEIGDVVGDQRRVEQVLLNLVNNAVKFTEQGQVSVSCELAADYVLTRVTDTGYGIRPEDIEKLFTAFQQLDSGIARQHEGTGLGLAICKRLVNLMGGTISVESEWKQGSSFSFTLPLQPTGGRAGKAPLEDSTASDP